MIQRSVVCTICKKRMGRIYLIDHYLESHDIPEGSLSSDPDKPFKCNRCLKSLKSWDGLKIHRREYCTGHEHGDTFQYLASDDLDGGWSPPAAITLYCKVCDVPYHLAKYNLARGYNPVQLGRIEQKLLNKEYCCRSCAYFIEKYKEEEERSNYCNLKNEVIDMPKTSICKQFEPNHS